MKYYFAFTLFLLSDLAAYETVPKGERNATWWYVVPGGGFIALYNHTHGYTPNKP